MAKRPTTLDRKLAQLARHAYEHAPAVKKIFDECGVQPKDIKRVGDLVRLPVTRKDRLIQLQREMLPFGGFLAADPKRQAHLSLPRSAL